MSFYSFLCGAFTSLKSSAASRNVYVRLTLLNHPEIYLEKRCLLKRTKPPTKAKALTRAKPLANHRKKN
jgi:hypothetical protein